MTTTIKRKRRKVRYREYVCRCPAYSFPHREGSKECARLRAEAADYHGECGTCGGSGGGDFPMHCYSCGGSGYEPGYRRRHMSEY